MEISMALSNGPIGVAVAGCYPDLPLDSRHRYNAATISASNVEPDAAKDFKSRS